MKKILVSLFFISVYYAKGQAWYIPLPSCSGMPTNCTIVAVNNGDWDAPSTWSPSRIPGNLDKVCIPEGKTVTVKNTQYTKIVSCPTSIINPNIAIFVCGTLNFDPSGTLYLGFNSLLQVLDPTGPANGIIKASNGNSDLIKFGCVLKWNGTYDINGPYYIGPVGEGPGVLPVAFDYFKAEQKSPYSINLIWGTLQEVNNTNFIIERSTDQKEFSAIGSVKSAGTSYVRNAYTFIDKNPIAGNNYYRLRQVDENGSITYSETVRVVNQVRKNFSLFPNPVTASAQLYSKTNFEKGQSIEIIDSKGIRIKSIVTNGSNAMQIDMSSLLPGLYLLRVTDKGNVVENISFIKQ